MQVPRIAFWVGLFILALYLLAFPRYVDPSPLLESYVWVDNLVRAKADQPALLSWVAQVPRLQDEMADIWTNVATIFSWPASIGLIPGFWVAQQFPTLNLNAVHLAWLGQGIMAAFFAASLIITMAWSRRRQLTVGYRIAGGIIVYLALIPFMQTLLTGENPIWLRSSEFGFPLRVHLLLPALIILLMLVITMIVELTDKRKKRASRLDIRVAIVILVILTIQMMIGAGYEIKSTKQAKADLRLLQTLADQTAPADALIIVSPNVDTAQLQTNLMLAYHRLALPTYIWLESDTILPIYWPELEREYDQIWLYETDLRQTDPLGRTAALLAQNGFPRQETWLDQVGRLTLFALPEQPTSPTPLNIPFEAGLTLVDFAITTATPTVGEPLQVRLTWHLAENAPFPTDNSPLIGFVHLLNDQQSGQTTAQTDRILVDYINHHQSPLLPGQTVSQGYLLQPTSQMSAGAYALIVGLYQADTGQRLRRVDNSPDDFFYLMTLTFISH